MSLKISRSVLATAVVIGLGFLLSWGLLVGKPEPEPEPLPAEAVPLVDVVSVEPRPLALDVTTQGTVRPVLAIDLVSRVAGRVEFVAPDFAAGSFFREDDPLVAIEDVDYRFAIARAASQVAAAEQRVAEEQGAALQAKREWRDLGSPAANALFLREPQLASARAALKAAQADLEAAVLDLERTRIAAPFNGRISEKFVDVGQYVTPGTRIARVYATDAVEVRLPLTDGQVALLDLPLHYRGDDAVELPAVTLRATFGNRDWEWQGRIVRTDANIDEDSRVLYAVAEVREPFARGPGGERPPLVPGMFVSATVAGRTLQGVSSLPRSALRSDTAVMLVDSRQQVVNRAVSVLQSEAGRVWVQGLQRGDRVIVREPTIMVAGMRVEAQEVARVAGADR
ncbi:efflux RND transporter periplasmic adaptor subunit [Haliea sp. E1-2-M8]|uniref:efflux RND transporter periplasmic adaptor subunit n=1 Tax=Haliea sp. E1-2-M8 TaxID=3064706 RepID=UPI002717D938|nr:efflux RND transporter periplasmic adaptor subunit [Haliea sp. E1-2-M8]MDO8861760.1 efflux RND transporter periplasmic adaptor subunit [Haliea sp. E1-2-M8]